MQKFTFLLFSVLLSLNLISQDFIRCFSSERITYLDANSPGYEQNINKTLDEIAFASNHKDGNDEVYRIPVVIHILYSNQNMNLDDSVIINQINILNQDFRRRNPDTTLTRDVFKARAADANVEFYLAGIDPLGNPTNGITRTQSSANFALSVFNNNVKQTSAGGIDAWPTERYLNIWVCDLSIFGSPVILGYATPPEGAPNWPEGSGPAESRFDGVVVHYQVFGSNNPTRPENLSEVAAGRTTTHEIGHYLGLRHIWGDGGGFGGGDGCDVDDGIADTPNAAAASQQTCNYNSNTCVDTPVDEPDMIENYMDYSDERCMNMFSKGQVNAIRYCLENFRPELIDPNNAPIGIFEQNGMKRAWNVFPNPFQDVLKISLNEFIDDVTVSISSLDGKVYFKTTLNFSEFEHKIIDLATLNKGIYILSLDDKSSTSYHRIIRQ